MTRTLEEILAYSRETGMDWALTAEETGLLRREVERLRAKHHEASANAHHIEEIRLWLEREPGPYQHEVDDARDAAAWLLAVLDGRVVALTSERERGAKADALMLEKMHGLEKDLTEERAKREAAERIVSLRDAQIRRWEDKEVRRAVCCNNNEERADKAERELAEEQRQHATTKARLDGTSQAIPALVAPYRERAEKAEAHIAELQAFVDACRVRNCERRGRMPDDGTCGRCPPCLARDLAAKEE